MPLLPTHHALLVAELQNTLYDGKTVEQAFEYLNDPHSEVVTEDNHTRHTPIGILGELGLTDGKAFLAVLRAQLGEDYDSIVEEGADLAHPVTEGFLTQLRQAGAITEGVLEKLLDLGETEWIVTRRPRIVEAFSGQSGTDPALLSGFPNRIERDDFDAAWGEARG